MGLKFSGGSLNVSPRSGTSGSIDDLYDVIISNPVENDILTYDATVPAWKNVSLIAGNGLNQSFFQLDKTLSVVAAPAGGIVVNATGVAVDNTVLRSTSTNLTVTNLTVTGTLTANNAANTVNATFLDGQNSSFYRNATNINAGTLDAARLPISGVTAGVYGSGSNIPVLTIDNKGRITSASTVALATSSETVSGAVRLATGAETNNATSAILAVNPLNLGIFYAKKASPAFTGTPTTVTPSVGNNTTQIANTAFVTNAVSSKADINSPSLTGTPTAPTASSGNNTTQIANTAFVTNAVSSKADINSPSLTGTPTAPTASAGSNSTQLATTAFVAAAVLNNGGLGINQTWQVVSRTFGVDYVNNTGRPIMFVGTFNRNAVSTANVDLVIGGVQIPLARNTNSGGGNNSAGSLIIPNGMTYRLVNVGEGLSSYACYELR